MLSILQEEWALRALMASIMVGVMCGVIGCFIVLRNMALIGDALAHAILPGVVFAFMLVGYSILGFFVGAVIAGLLAAVGITWIQLKAKTKSDAAIGIVFTAMFSIGVMAISWISKEQGVHLDLKDFLFGNILGISNEDLILTFVITLYTLFSIAVYYRALFATTFQPVLAQTMGISTKMVHYFLMLLLSFAVVASLRTVGVILVVAMLITPASTALLISNKLKHVLVISALFGVLSSVLGLFFSIWFGTTPGPAMAVTATLFYFLAVLFAPSKGLVSRFIQTTKLKSKIRFEDTLKQALKLHEREMLTIDNLVDRLGLSSKIVRQTLLRLIQQGFISSDTTGIQMSTAGITAANKLVRAHRLWETYLVQQMGLTEEQIHEDAEKYEHLLTDEMLNEVDRELGYPEKDPHGSPIPPQSGHPFFSIKNLKKGQLGSISSNQSREDVIRELWSLGLNPGDEIKILDDDGQVIQIDINGRLVTLPIEKAKRIRIDSHEHVSN